MRNEVLLSALAMCSVLSLLCHTLTPLPGSYVAIAASVISGTYTLLCSFRFVGAAKDVHYFAPIHKYGLINDTTWRYIYNNGDHSLFDGYKWSLDVFVDYTWSQLGTLTATMIILLVMEVRVHEGFE